MLLKPVHVEFLVERVVTRQVLRTETRFSPDTIIIQILHSHTSFICRLPSPYYIR